MSETVMLSAIIKKNLQDIAKQTLALGIGLQNAAPGSRTGAANKSVEYLFKISERLINLANQCDDLDDS